MMIEIPLITPENLKIEYQPIYSQWLYCFSFWLEGTQFIAFEYDRELHQGEKLQQMIAMLQNRVDIRFGAWMNGYRDGEEPPDPMMLFNEAREFFLKHPEYEIEPTGEIH